MMRRVSLLVVPLLAVLLAGCGQGSGSGGGDAERTALSYLPRRPALVTLVRTDPDSAQVKAGLELVRRFPGGEGLLRQTEHSFELGGIEFDKDVKPLLGNPVAIGSATPDGDAVLAWQAKDADVLERVIGASGARKTGEYKGATLYTLSSRDDTAVDGDVFVRVLGQCSQPCIHAQEYTRARAVRDALDRHEGGSGLSPDDLPADLGDDALVRGTGTRSFFYPDQRRVPWVAALKHYGFAVSANDSGARIELRADTSGGNLEDADVPLALGDAAPRVADTGQLAVGVRDLGHVFAFALRAMRAANPKAGLAAYLRSIRASTGVDVEHDVLGQLRSDATFTTDLARSYALRATARDPARLTRSLSRLERKVELTLRAFLYLPFRIRRAGTSLWTVSVPKYGVVGSYGVVGDQFVAGVGALSDLQSFARHPGEVPRDAKGALAVELPARGLARMLSARGIPAGPGSLGGLHGSVAATADGVAGSFRLDVP